MNISWPALGVLVAGLLFYMTTAVADTALALASHHEVRRRAEQGQATALMVEHLWSHKRRWMATAVLMRIGALLVCGGSLLRLIAPLSTLWTVLVTLLVVLLVTLLQLTGRLWVQDNATLAALRLAPYMRLLLGLLAPATSLLRSVADRLSDSAGANEDAVLLSETGVRLLLPDDSEETELEESEKEMITSILEMDETVAREVMVPRIDMVALDVQTSVDDALEVILKAGHSRVPIYDDNIDQIVGVLYAKDLLRIFQEKRSDAPLQTLMRPAYFVPLTKNVKNLLTEMRKHRVHIAIVVDEYGGTAGLVTIEDILEEIVGEIQDEYDAVEEVLVQRLPAGGYLINGRLDIYSLEKLLHVELSDDDADTVGGFVLSQLGHVPAPGEATERKGWLFTVLHLDGRRVSKLRVEPIPALTPSEPEPPAEARAHPNGRGASGRDAAGGSQPFDAQTADAPHFAPSDH